jgi:hypothetical protein
MIARFIVSSICRKRDELSKSSGASIIEQCLGADQDSLPLHPPQKFPEEPTHEKGVVAPFRHAHEE